MPALRIMAKRLPDVPWLQITENAQNKAALSYQPMVKHKRK